MNFHSSTCEFSGNFSHGRLQSVNFDGIVKVAKALKGRRLLVENENITLSDMDIQWHPAFCAAAELEFMANKTELDF